jgi:hypothetical protein
MFSLTYFLEIADEVEVLNVHSTFQCDKDVGIEHFLTTLVVPFKKTNKAGTYFILNDNYLET